MDVVHEGVGQLFTVTSDAVVVLEQGRVVAWNPRAQELFGVAAADAESGAPTPLHPHLPALLALDPQGGPQQADLSPYAVVDATRRVIEGRDVLLLHDVTAVLRHADGLRRIARLSTELLGGPGTVPATLQSLAGEARAATGAAFSAVLLLREGSTTETTHFAYDAPRHLFPDRVPRAVGLLGVPVTTRRPVRLDDVRGHPAAVGLPGVHPPIGPLLAVPLLAGGALLGELAVADRPGGRTFSALDEELLVELAALGAVAVRWAQEREAAREQARRRQEDVDAARHDIRTPLGAGKGYAALLATRMDRMSPAQVATALEGLRSAFDRIEAFSARLLLDERLASTSLQPRWEQVDVAAVLEEVRRDAEVVTGRPGAVVVHHEPGAPEVLAGDPVHVREVVDNLVGNALKHGPPTAPVTVTVRAEGDHVRLDVRDEGPGIAEQEQARLFDRWTRTDAARDARVPGLGLGLSIVQRLVLAHGGLLGVSSRPGEGATFWVTFPTSPPPKESG